MPLGVTAILVVYCLRMIDLHDTSLASAKLAGIAATVDAKELPVADSDFDFSEGHFIDAEFLAGALGGNAAWVEEENTLMLKIPEAE